MVSFLVSGVQAYYWSFSSFFPHTPVSLLFPNGIRSCICIFSLMVKDFGFRQPFLPSEVGFNTFNRQPSLWSFSNTPFSLSLLPPRDKSMKGFSKNLLIELQVLILSGLVSSPDEVMIPNWILSLFSLSY